jgi:hypothetical protein
VLVFFFLFLFNFFAVEDSKADEMQSVTQQQSFDLFVIRTAGTQTWADIDLKQPRPEFVINQDIKAINFEAL